MGRSRYSDDLRTRVVTAVAEIAATVFPTRSLKPRRVQENMKRRVGASVRMVRGSGQAF